jgi:hypothetical protein
MTKRVKVDTKDIPGGKALAQYVAQVVVAHQHQQKNELKRLKTKIERQKTLVRYFNPAGNGKLRFCRQCGFGIQDNAEYATFCAVHGTFCKDCCSKNGKCKSCWFSCRYDGCEAVFELTHPGDKGYICNVCQTDICDDHTEYCRYCAVPLCIEKEQCKLKHIKKCERAAKSKK